MSPRDGTHSPVQPSAPPRVRAVSAWDRGLVRTALADSVRKLDPRRMARNPVMFVVEVGSVLTTLAWLRDLVAPVAGAAPASFNGQLALWLAARHRQPPGAPGHAPAPLRLRGVVSLAGVTDLEAGARGGICGDAIPRLLGGDPAALPQRVASASPIRLLPLGLPQRLVCGKRDSLVPIEQARSYEAAAREAGDAVRVDVVETAGHFELVDPASGAWPTVRDAVSALLGPAPKPR